MLPGPMFLAGNASVPPFSPEFLARNLARVPIRNSISPIYRLYIGICETSHILVYMSYN